MTYSNIIFGGIGTLVETSQYQLDAYNVAFKTVGIDFVWSRDDYAKSLSSSGGRNRLAEITLEDGRKLTDEEIARIHEIKTDTYDATIVNRGLALRDGVAGLIDFCKLNGLPIAFASTTSRKNIDAIFEATGQALKDDVFLFVGDGSKVENGKPDPKIYDLAVEALGAEKGKVLAIEDSPTGVETARAAGIDVVAFPGEMTAGKDFSGAIDTVSSVGQVMKRLETAR